MIDATKDQEDMDSNGPSFIGVLLTTFATVFLAELGDKTQIATLLLSAQCGNPTIVFIGAALALICSSLVGVFVGRLLASNLSTEKIEYMAGIFMVGLGIWIAIQASQSLLSNLQFS